MLEPRRTCAMACIRFGYRAWKMVSSPIYWPRNPIDREMEYVSPALTETYDRYGACAMRTGKPVQRPRSVCNPARLRFTAVRSGINAAPTNELLDTRAFTGPETQDFSVLRPVTSAFRTGFDSCARTNVGRNIFRTSEATAIRGAQPEAMPDRRVVDNAAATGDGRDCAARFCFLQRGAAATVRKNSQGGTGWVLRGYSGVLQGYCRVLLEYFYSRCSSEEQSSIHFCELERFHELLWAALRHCHTAARCRVTKQCAGQHAHTNVSGSLSCT